MQNAGRAVAACSVSLGSARALPEASGPLVAHAGPAEATYEVCVARRFPSPPRCPSARPVAMAADGEVEMAVAPEEAAPAAVGGGDAAAAAPSAEEQVRALAADAAGERQRRLAELEAERKRLVAQRRQVQKTIKNEKKKDKRLMEKAKGLSDAALLQVIAARAAQAAAKAKAKAAPKGKAKAKAKSAP